MEGKAFSLFALHPQCFFFIAYSLDVLLVMKYAFESVS